MELVGESFYEAQVHAQVGLSGRTRLRFGSAVGPLRGSGPRGSQPMRGRASLCGRAYGPPASSILHLKPHSPRAPGVQARAAAEGRVFISAYDDPFTIAGQGTIG